MAPTTTRRTVLAGGTILLAGHAAAQQATTLRLYSWGYRGGPAALVAEVPRLTGGRYRVERVTGFDSIEAALGKERAAGGDSALFEGVRRGDLDLVTTSAYSLGEYVPETQAIYAPFLFRDMAHARAVLDGPIGQDLLGRLTAQGLVGLAWSEDGLRHVVNSKHPIRTPEDLEGLKLRIPPNPVMVETFRSLGAEVTPMPWGRAAVDALAQGALDGTDTSIFSLWTWELFRSLKYLSLTGHCYAPGVIVMSRAVHDRLSEADRQAVVQAARLSAQLDREQSDNEEAAGVADLLSVGMQINNDVDKVAFRAALAPAYAKWRERFGDLIDRIQAYG